MLFFLNYQIDMAVAILLIINAMIIFYRDVTDFFIAKVIKMTVFALNQKMT